MSNIGNRLPDKEVTLKTIFGRISSYWNLLISKWILVIIFGFGGAAIGFGLSYIIKPKYTAHLSFALIERSSGGGLASLASSFGLSGMFGGSNGSAFSGDNLLEIIKSRYAIEKTLLTPVEFKGENKTLMDAYIQFNNMHKSWKKSKIVELKTLNYPISQPREKFTRVQDSVLFDVYSLFVKSNALTVIRKDKKIGIVNVDFTSKNEQFSKLFVDYLMKQTIQFYTETRTAQSRSNIEMMEHTADSIKNLYESALYNSASISQVNVNTALQTAVVPRLKQENNAQLYGAVYAEVLKNLETLKLDMVRETPIVQIIDTPRYPLKKNKIGKAKGLVFGGFAGGVLIVVFILGWYNLKEVLK
jgi:hypothetical protein